MPSVPALLRRHRELAQQQTEIERQIADVEREIEAVADGPRPRKQRSTKAEMVEVIRDTVKVLREAEGPLPRREIAQRLGISAHAASYRLKKAIEMKFVEKVAMGMYRLTNVVPAF